MDVYRLNGKLGDIDIEEYYNKGGITIIEWADTILDMLPNERLDIEIRVNAEEKRTFYN